MMSKFRRLAVLLVAAGFVSFGATQPAKAVFQVRIYDGVGAPVVVTDNGVGDNAAGAPGVGTINTLTIVLSSGVQITVATSTSNATTAGDPAQMTLNVTVNNLTGSTSTIYVTATDDQFSVPSAIANPLRMTSSIAGTQIGNNVTLQSFADAGSSGNPGIMYGATVADANLALVSTGSAITTGTQSALALSGSGDVSIPFNKQSTANYSLTAAMTLTVAAGTAMNANGQILVTTPEPSSMAMALAALPLMGLGGWVRRRRAQA